MTEISADEVLELAEAFGVDVARSEVDELVEAVNVVVDRAGDSLELAVSTRTDGRERRRAPGERTWNEPVDDPHNALAVACSVPPVDGADGVLDGVSVGVKDNIAVAGVPMSCGSGVMYGYVPDRDAPVAERIREAGGRITAKTNLDELAATPAGTTSYRSPIRNPHDPERSAGGSSGGSAAAVAADRVDVALGTDTGGSVRIPASLCGVVGLVPTHGLVPQTGVVENTYTLDHVGVLAPTVEETAAALEAIAGKDTGDAASTYAAGLDEYRTGGYATAVADPPAAETLEIGVVTDGFGDGVADEIAGRTEAAIDRAADAGATVRRLAVDGFEYEKRIKDFISYSEVATHWRAGGAGYRRPGRVPERYQTAFSQRSAGASGELGTFYKAKIVAGAWLLASENGRHYTRAKSARSALQAAVADAVSGVDALVMPTTPQVAPEIGDLTDGPYDYGRNTRFVNVSHHPAVTLPNGAVDGLPVGLQLVGSRFGEHELLGAAETLSRYTADPP